MLTAVSASVSALEFVSAAARRAPRVDHNVSWKIAPAGYTLQFRAPADYGERPQDDRRLRINCGSGVEFARYAVRSLGHACIVRVVPNTEDSALLATLTETYALDQTPAELSMITAMRMADWPASAPHAQVLLDDLFALLGAAARDRGCWIRRVEPPVAQPLRSAFSLLGGADIETVAPHPAPTAWLVVGSDVDDAPTQVRIGRVFAQTVLYLRFAGLRWHALRPVPEVPTALAHVGHELSLIGTPQLVLAVG